MTVYKSLGNAIGTADAVDLARRLASWHDAMVVHQRRLALSGDRCSADCPHREASDLWADAIEAFGDRAHELSFLRTHGDPPRRARPGRTIEMHL